jgi:hypothetical protein
MGETLSHEALDCTLQDIEDLCILLKFQCGSQGMQEAILAGLLAWKVR